VDLVVPKRGSLYTRAWPDRALAVGLFTSEVPDGDYICKVEVVESLFDPAYESRKFTIRDFDGNELGSVEG